MNDAAIIVIIGATAIATLFLTWNKVWGIAKGSIKDDVSIDLDARCNKRISDLTNELKEAIMPMSEDVTQIRTVVSGLKLDHETLKGDLKAIDATMTSISGHLDAVDKKAARAEKMANDNRVAIASSINGND